MLPDVSKRRKLRGFDRRLYDSDQLHLIIDFKNNDGCTTRNGVDIVKRMNSYLEKSRYFVIESSTIFYFMKDLLEGSFSDSNCEILKLYADNIDRELLGRSMKNVMKVTKSVASQRSLLKDIKKVVKVNKVTKDWDDLLNAFLDDLEKRLTYLHSIVIPANVEVTPMGVYMDYLSEKQISIYDDIHLFVDNSGAIFDDDDQSLTIYKDHVIQVLDRLDTERSDALLDKARHEMELRNKRIQKIKDSIEAEKSAALSAALEQYKAEVLNLCSVAEKNFINQREVTANHRAKSSADIYLVVAANVDLKRIGYLKKAGRNKLSISSIKYASAFTKEDAEKAVDMFKSKGGNRIAEIAKVQLYSYGIGF